MNDIPVATFEFHKKYLSIIPIGDLHIGSAGSKWKEALEVIEKFKDSYIIYMGDVVNNSIKNSIGNVYEDVLTPSESMKILRDKFLVPFKDRTLALIIGNHEQRSVKDTDDSTIENMCYLLKIPFSKTCMVLDISLKHGAGIGSKRRLSYSIVIAHGNAGGRFIEKSARQWRYFDNFIEGVDCYISAHTHIPMVIPTAVWKYDAHNKKVLKTTRRHIVIPSWVEDDYAKRKMLPPSPNVVTEIILKGGLTKSIEIRETSL